MKTIAKFFSVIAMVAIVSTTGIKAQDSIVTAIGADVVSRYVWRGVPVYEFTNMGPGGSYTNFISPNIQPAFSASYKGFTLGAWGSFDFTGAYHETDLYLTYTAGPVAFTVNDYYWNYMGRYMDLKNESTPHIIEGVITGKAGAFSATVATMLYGADKKWSVDSLGVAAPDKKKNNYSTYIELGYAFKVSGVDYNATMGASPYNGFYGAGYKNYPLYANVKPVEGFGIVNLGLSASKALKFSDDFSLPVKTSLIVNPQLEKAFLVVGFTF